MRQSIFTRTLLTLIAVLSLQHVSPARVARAGDTAEKPATADKATQTDPVSFEATLSLKGVMTPMDYQAMDTAPSDDKQEEVEQPTTRSTPDSKQEKAERPTASVKAHSGSKGQARAKQGKTRAVG